MFESIVVRIGRPDELRIRLLQHTSSVRTYTCRLDGLPAVYQLPFIHKFFFYVLVGFADARYLYDSHKSHSQSGYVLTMGNTELSWRFTKQTLIATSLNNVEIIALIMII